MEKLILHNKVFLLWLLFIPFYSVAQTEDEIEQEIENWAENEESIIDFQDLFDQIAMNSNTKLNLNKVTYSDLSRFPFLTPSQIFAILQHRERFGAFISIYELQVIEEIDEQTIYRIMPYLMVTNSPFELFNLKPSFDKIFKNEITFLYSERLEKSKGFSKANDTSTAPFAGNPQRYVLRYRGSFKNKINYGFSGEKDAGEAFFRKNNPQGFDFNSMYITYKNNDGLIKELFLGDFQASFGQGLTFGSGLSFGKSALITNIKKNLNGFRPNRSLNENDFLRGVGITLAWKQFELSSFAARNRMDGTISESDTLQDYTFSSFASTGLHRTLSEINKKNSVGRTMYGSNVNWKSHNLSIGYTSIYAQYDYIFSPRETLYNKFRFKGVSNFNQGLNYNYLTGNLLLFGELSSSSFFQGISFIQGGLLSLGKKLDFAFLHRNIAKDYTFVYSTAFSETTTISNEKGTYFGFVWRPIYRWSVNLYYDIFSHDWLRYRVDAPSEGSDFLTEIHYSERKRFELYGRLRVKNKAINKLENNFHLNSLNQTQKYQFRFNAHYFISNNLTLKARTEWVQFTNSVGNTNPQFGSLTFIDISKQFLKTKLSLRYTLFNIENYDSRIYSYESDVLYTYSIPSFQNTGSKIYILAKTKLYKGVDLWVKFTQTTYSNINSIGSGQDKIIGNKVHDLKFQLRWSF